jgi:FAD:protein FMN transferase
MIRHAFEAMGTDVECLLIAEEGSVGEASFAAVEEEFRRLDELFSRFRPDSELSRLNSLGALNGSTDLIRVTELALEARERTNGRFDPTVHDALVAAGYDRTFAELDTAGEADSAPGGACGGRVQVDSESGAIELGQGVHLDFGGIAKGYAVDRACDLLSEAGPCLVNAGGDLAVRGRLADGPWPVGVETADGSIVLGLEEGAIATSGRDRRRWRRNGHEHHHIIDPSTGRPAETGLLRVTVVASSSVEAEVAAKAIFLAGQSQGMQEADELGIPCVFVTDDGRTLTAGGLA